MLNLSGRAELRKLTSTALYLGIVPSPLFTTLMQVASRLFLMWLVTYPFPSVTTSPAYSSMLCAWSLTEMIRYSYFAIKQGGATPPYWLHWLRYSAFAVLYPIGISSELAEVYLAIKGPAADLVWWAPYALLAVAAVYAPGKHSTYQADPLSATRTDSRIYRRAKALHLHGEATPEAVGWLGGEEGAMKDTKRLRPRSVSKKRGVTGSFRFAWPNTGAKGSGPVSIL